MSGGHHRLALRGRQSESDALDRLLAGARDGRSGVLVLRGESGVGKTALLDLLVARAGAFRIARASGVESEMELAFSGLHQLCAPLLNRLDHLPVPHREDQRDPLRPQPSRHKRKTLRRNAIEPLRVVDHTHQRMLIGHLGQETQDG